MLYGDGKGIRVTAQFSTGGNRCTDVWIGVGSTREMNLVEVCRDS